jgi:hypothetical protein
MKPIDFFDQLDQAHEAGAGSLKGDAHAALWLAQRLRRISCLGKAPAGSHASFRVGQQASAASSPAALQCISLRKNQKCVMNFPSAGVRPACFAGRRSEAGLYNPKRELRGLKKVVRNFLFESAVTH